MAANRLENSSSAYLKSASHQPIDWYEFGEEAFQRAKEMDRLILLDIGAVWCHWCHVIDRESYENDEIAQLINQHYVAVKVDRDQRPDIDARYQQVVASMTGQGGWPLTAFLTSDGRVIYGGTYFPPEAMKKILLQLKDVYQEQKADIMRESLEDTPAEEISGNQQATEAEEARKTIPEDVFNRVLNNATQTFDPVYGGFGMYPKFPHYSTLEYLIQQTCNRNQNKELLEVLDKTLTQMALGGIYDHIGGGFHRYSVDREWHVPHFEKMAYDNAEALRVYAQAYRLLGNPLYLETINGILRFTAEVLSDPGGAGFYASQDADIDLNDDGDFFTWTLDEVNTVLTPDEAELMTLYYDLTSQGDMHERPGRNVLWVRRTLDDLSRRFGQPEEMIMTRIQVAKDKLKTIRDKRPVPYIDRTVYLNWNGMYLTAYFETADLLNRNDVRIFARKTIDTLLQSHVDIHNNQLLHCAGVPGMLEDYAWMIQALIKAYQSTEDEVYLDNACHWADIAGERFEDKVYGGFYDISTPDGKSLALLKFRRKPTEDTPSSSANAVMLRNLVHLYYLTGEVSYLDRADRGFKVFGREFSGKGIYACALTIALFEHRYPPLKLEVTGQNPALKQAARSTFAPGKLVSYTLGANTDEIRICQGTRCVAPVNTPEALEKTLTTLPKPELAFSLSSLD